MRIYDPAADEWSDGPPLPTPAHHLGAVLDGLLGMKCALLAGKALADHACVFVDEYGHVASFDLHIDDDGRGAVEDHLIDRRRVAPSRTALHHARAPPGPPLIGIGRLMWIDG